MLLACLLKGRHSWPSLASPPLFLCGSLRDGAFLGPPSTAPLQFTEMVLRLLDTGAEAIEEVDGIDAIEAVQVGSDTFQSLILRGGLWHVGRKGRIGRLQSLAKPGVQGGLCRQACRRVHRGHTGGSHRAVSQQLFQSVCGPCPVYLAVRRGTAGAAAHGGSPG